MITRADLSSEALRAISPDLTLTTLGRLANIDPGHLGRIANGRRRIPEWMQWDLKAALVKARKMAAAGTLPKRHPQGMKRIS